MYHTPHCIHHRSIKIRKIHHRQRTSSTTGGIRSDRIQRSFMPSRRRKSGLPPLPAGSIPTGAQRKRQGGKVRSTTKARPTDEDHRPPRQNPPPSAAVGTAVSLRVSRVSRNSKAGKSKTRSVRASADSGAKQSRSEERKQIKPTKQIKAPSKRAYSRPRPVQAYSRPRPVHEEVSTRSVGSGYVKLADRLGVAGITLSESYDSFSEYSDESEEVVDLFSAIVSCTSAAVDGDLVPFPDKCDRKATTNSLYLGDAERQARNERRYDDDGSRDERDVLGALKTIIAPTHSRESESYSSPDESAVGSIYIGGREAREDRYAVRARSGKGSRR